LFSGALSKELISSGLYSNSCDATQASVVLWDQAKDDLFGFLEDSSHRKRLAKLNIVSDIHFCLKLNQTSKVPVLKGDVLVVNDECLDI